MTTDARDPVAAAPEIVFLCTGNAARSVMAAALFRARARRFVALGAGTHVIEGHPMSVRTRRALAGLGLADPDHASRQLRAADVESARLVVAMAPEHVAWVRRALPEAADRTATLKRLVRDLPGPQAGTLADRVAALALAGHDPAPDEEVVDPAGGEQDAFDACAAELAALVAALVDRLEGPGESSRHSSSR